MSTSKLVAKLLAQGIQLTPEALSTIRALSPQILSQIVDQLIRECPEVVDNSTIMKIVGKGIVSIEVFSPGNGLPITTAASPSDWHKYYNSRFSLLSAMFVNRGLENQLNCSEVNATNGGGKMTVVGMVSSKVRTKRGHIILTLEDTSGLCKAIVYSGSSITREIKNVIEDDVIAVTGRFNKSLSMISVDEFLFPDLPLISDINSEGVVVFASDFHVGSREHVESAAQTFIDYINRHNEEIVGLVIAGDLLDGLGVFPQQAEHLVIKSVVGQAKAAAALLDKIPKRIPIVILSGNHDIFPFFPAPPIPKRLAEALYDLPNVKMVGNPAQIIINGVKILAYHGHTFNQLSSAIGQPCTTETLSDITKLFLKRRHFAVAHGTRGNKIVPTPEDYLVIREAPNIMCTAHVHIHMADKYKNTILVNPGTFQEKTPYQEELGIEPTPPSFAVVNLKTGQTTIEKC